MKKTCFALAVVGLSTLVAAQEQTEPGQVVADRVMKGGWFEKTRWQRGADGSLEMHYFADVGGSIPDGQLRFKPVLGEKLENGFQNSGAVGFLSLFCHGNGDLLSMTDVEYHFGALGVDTSDVGMRQFLIVPPPSFEGQRGRAEMLDRMLAIDVLTRRNCKSALGELRVLAANEKLPAALRERAQRASAVLSGETKGTERKRLDAATLNLPAAFDGCVLVDHARLPDLGWLTPLGRRLGALVTAQTIVMAGGTISPAMCNGAQSMCDVVSELPFGVAHQFGNVRIDQSLLVISAKADPEMPVALSWQAAGEFEAELLKKAELPAGIERNNPIFGGKLEVVADRVVASTDGSVGKPRPAMVEKLGLLEDAGCAIRAIVPANSKLWPALAFLKLPSAERAELCITFGDPGVITLQVQTRDEETAEAWVAAGKEMLAQAKAMFAQELPPVFADSPDVQQLLAGLYAAQLSSKDASATARIEVKGMTPAKIKALCERQFQW